MSDRRPAEALFGHERLAVYEVGLDFLGFTEDLVVSVPPGRKHLIDQLDRAATSVVLNIAEGAGEFSPPEKARFYRMARRSATECAAILDVFHKRGLCNGERREVGRQKLWEIVAMLTSMVRKLDGRGRGIREDGMERYMTGTGTAESVRQGGGEGKDEGGGDDG